VEDLVNDDAEEQGDEGAGVPVQEQDDANGGIISCRVCHKMLLDDNDEIIQHIDLCLNGEMVRTNIREEDQPTSPQIQQKKGYASLLSTSVHRCSSSIQSTQVRSTSPPKRQKRTIRIDS
jgi:hypothetical protein